MKKIVPFVIILCLASAMYLHTEAEPMAWREYTIIDGDTLSDISKSITPNSEDYRETLHDIIEKNKLSNKVIHPGDTILSPYEEEVQSLGTYQLTAYCSCVKCCGKSDGITASGVKATAGRTVAVDSSIPFGTRLIIDGHEYVAEDRGGGIKGKRIDVYFDSHQEAIKFGVQHKEVYIVKE